MGSFTTVQPDSPAKDFNDWFQGIYNTLREIQSIKPEDLFEKRISDARKLYQERLLHEQRN